MNNVINLNYDNLTEYMHGNDEISNFVRTASTEMLKVISWEAYTDEIIWEEVVRAVRTAAEYVMNNYGECACGVVYTLGADDHYGECGSCRVTSVANVRKQHEAK